MATNEHGWKCNELANGWCWLRDDRAARILASCASPDVYTVERRDAESDHFVAIGTRGSLTSAMVAGGEA